VNSRSPACPTRFEREQRVEDDSTAIVATIQTPSTPALVRPRLIPQISECLRLVSECLQSRRERERDMHDRDGGRDRHGHDTRERQHGHEHERERDRGDRDSYSARESHDTTRDSTTRERDRDHGRADDRDSRRDDRRGGRESLDSMHYIDDRREGDRSAPASVRREAADRHDRRPPTHPATPAAVGNTHAGTTDRRGERARSEHDRDTDRDHREAGNVSRGDRTSRSHRYDDSASRYVCEDAIDI
jgi:hypothetical protein